MKKVDCNKLNCIVAFDKHLEVTDQTCMDCQVIREECDIYKLKQKARNN